MVVIMHNLYTIQYPSEYYAKHGVSLIIYHVMELLLKLEENQYIFLKNGHKISILSLRYVCIPIFYSFTTYKNMSSTKVHCHCQYMRVSSHFRFV
jgi:hypothetical protein